MSAHRLSEDQVAGELNKMVEFIKKEADEKAKEIELKVCFILLIGYLKSGDLKTNHSRPMKNMRLKRPTLSDQRPPRLMLNTNENTSNPVFPNKSPNRLLPIRCDSRFWVPKRRF